MLSASIFGGLLPAWTWVLLALCLAVSSIGFYRLVYFISIGYGFAIAASAIATLAVGLGTASLAAWIQSALLAVYGLRLGIFLARREADARYRESQSGELSRPEGAALGVKLAIWASVSLLYVCQYAPALARLAADARGLPDATPWLSFAGLAVMAAGLAIEWAADLQKTAAKRLAPGRFCSSGLYRLTRCPNYFGETLLWTGNLIAGASALGNPLFWALAAIGFACISLIMVGSARRLELKQEERYGSDPEYRSYSRSVPILFPLVPVYSLKKARLYLG